MFEEVFTFPGILILCSKATFVCGEVSEAKFNQSSDTNFRNEVSEFEAKFSERSSEFGSQF